MLIKTYNLEEIERIAIITCLNEHKGFSLLEIAEILGISERTLYRKLNKYDIRFNYLRKHERPLITSAT